MGNVLVTGFEPFGGEAINPSAEVALALNGQTVSGRGVVGEVLPCVFGLALKQLKRHVRATRPELVLCLGQAGGRALLAVERVAINVDDARIPDNAGAQPIDQPIAIRGPVAYWSTLPIKSIVSALNEAGVGAEVSQSAGTFVCNHVFYGLMRTLHGKWARGGFIHLPYASEQGKAPSLPLADLVAAIRLALEVSLATRVDARLVGGALHG